MSHAGKQSFVFENPPTIAAHVSVAGPREGAGPLGKWFDTVLEDDLLGQKSWERRKARCCGNAPKRPCGLPACQRRKFRPSFRGT